MKKSEFKKIRQKLGKTQKQIAQLLGASLKAVQSFEQGWREIPVHAERQMLFLLGMKCNQENPLRPCWEIRNCPEEKKRACPAWEFQCVRLCWFVTGTVCETKVYRTWKEKIAHCRTCIVLQGLLSYADQHKKKRAGSSKQQPRHTRTNKQA